MARVFYIKATRQIDERFGQFGGDADLAAQFRRASKKILLVPGVRVFHLGAGDYTAQERADALLAHAAFHRQIPGLLPPAWWRVWLRSSDRYSGFGSANCATPWPARKSTALSNSELVATPTANS